MARSKRKKIVPVDSVKVSVGREHAPVVWVGWQIRRGEKYFGVVQRADGTVERTRLDRGVGAAWGCMQRDGLGHSIGSVYGFVP
jgi:hypothetical protein